MTDADKALQQDMGQETLNELLSGEFDDAGCATRLAIGPSELNVFAVETDESVVGDRDAMGIAAPIPENLCGTAKGRFGIDDPGMDVQSPDPGTETGGIFQGLELWREPDLVGGDEVFEPVEELAAKNRAQYTSWQQESFRGRSPLRVAGIEAAAGNDTMDVGMED